MINRVLKAAIIEASGTQGKFAAEIGKPAPFVSEVVRGHKKLSIGERCLWAAKLKRGVRELFPDDGS